MPKHIPVLLNQVIEVLKPKQGETFIDMTCGYGGHSQKLLQLVGNSGYGYLIDRDWQAISYLKKLFASKQNVRIIHSNFSQLGSLGLPKVDMILMDLGVSSAQLDQADRGFSFWQNARLDMRMDRSQKLDAHYVVNNYSQKKLAEIIASYGEETQSRKIARAILAARKIKPIDTTLQLADIISSQVRKSRKIHPATKTFQAIRIAVNDELNELKTGLEEALKILKPGGRLAVISFHSLEDRIVKTFIQQYSQDIYDIDGKLIRSASLKKVTKKPILGSLVDYHRRARSAKLRAAVKIK